FFLRAVGVLVVSFRAGVLCCLALRAFSFAAAAAILRSGMGRSLVGVMHNEQRMRALGLTVWRVKADVFGLSGLIAGLAGVMAAQHVMFVSPGLLSWTVSGEALVVVILGGLGTLIGPIIGAVVFVLLKHEIGEITTYWHLVVGVILIGVVMSRANGVFGFLETRIERWSARRNRPARALRDDDEATRGARVGGSNVTAPGE
ncbi:MAG: branched-chain amino acid ABC transporter permease, partial [Paracoccaceae bacterium]